MTRYYRLRRRALLAVARHWDRRVECFGRPARWCGLRHQEFLELDHRDGSGRLTNRAGGGRRLREALAHPERFQLLCGHHHARKTRARGENSRHR